MRSPVAIRAISVALVLTVGGQVALAANNGTARVQTQATMAATMAAGTMAAMPATMAATMAASSAMPNIVTLDGYTVSLFASSTADYFAPDSLVVAGGNVFIGYQNKTAKDCTDKNSSTIVEYTMDGKVVNKFSVPGHSDGMRIDPTSGLLWATSCEDGNAQLATINIKSGAVTSYAFPAAPHKGGYDDLYFVNGIGFVAASNPTLDDKGTNPNPAVDQIALTDGKIVLTPVLNGNDKAMNNLTSPASTVTLNLTDPDSLSVDDKGNLVLVCQADSALITIANPGTPKQAVSVLPVGTQLDDTVWATSKSGALLVADATTGNTYWVKSSSFVVGGIYTQTPDDSGVAGVLATVDPATGFLSPFAIGFAKPTGMVFVPAN